MIAVLVLVLPAGLLCGCKRDIDSKDAVRQGVMNYLAKRSDLLSMDVSVTGVSFSQDHATATVHFQAKGNTAPAAGMTMQYVLDRSGSQWVVKARAGSANPHGAGGLPPSGAGSIGAMPQTLPPGHPSVNSGDKQKP